MCNIIKSFKKGIFPIIIKIYIFFFILFFKNKSNKIDVLLIKENFNYIDKIIPYLNKANINFTILYRKNNMFHYYLSKNKHFISGFKIVITENIGNYLKAVLSKQIHICIWHAFGSYKKLVNDNYNINYITSTSKFCSKNLKNAFNLKEENILNYGHPSSVIYFNESDKLKLKSEFFNKYPALKGKKIYLYAPTFRREKDLDINSYKKNYLNLKDLSARLLDNEVFLIKDHNNITNKKFYSIVENNANVKNIIYINNNEDMFTLSLVVEVLITDYSSSLFQGIMANKPIVFFALDYDNYAKNTGFYFDPLTEGPWLYPVLSNNVDDLLKAIRTESVDTKKYKDFKEKHLVFNREKSIIKFISFLKKLLNN